MCATNRIGPTNVVRGDNKDNSDPKTGIGITSPSSVDVYVNVRAAQPSGNGDAPALALAPQQPVSRCPSVVKNVQQLCLFPQRPSFNIFPKSNNLTPLAFSCVLDDLVSAPTRIIFGVPAGFALGIEIGLEKEGTGKLAIIPLTLGGAVAGGVMGVLGGVRDVISASGWALIGLGGFLLTPCGAQAGGVCLRPMVDTLDEVLRT